MRSSHHQKPYWRILFLWVVVMLLGTTGSAYQFWKQEQRRQLAIQEASLQNLALQAEPKLTLDSIASMPAISARSVLIYERNSDSLLYESNANTATSVASLAKMMTALISFEEYGLEDPVVIGSASAAIGNRAKFRPLDQFQVYDLLKALLIFSANDAAEALAFHHPDGLSAFVETMNVRAQELGMTNTIFTNPSGLDNSHQLSSAADLARLADTILEVPVLANIVSQPTATIRELKTNRFDTVYTTNALLYKNAKYQGMKTGTTELAGESLAVRVVTTQNDGTELDLILVLLGSQNRFPEAERLTEWVTQVVRWEDQ